MTCTKVKATVRALLHITIFQSTLEFRKRTNFFCTHIHIENPYRSVRDIISLSSDKLLIIFSVLNNYFTWKLMRGYVTDLGWQYVHANRVFYVARTGLPEFTGIPTYCFNQVQHHFRDALGALYIKDHLLANDKAMVIDFLLLFFYKFVHYVVHLFYNISF